MAFPTSRLVDNFNRADENPLSDGGLYEPAAGMKLVSHTAVAITPTTAGAAAATVASYAGPAEVWVTLLEPNAAAQPMVFIGELTAGYAVVAQIASGVPELVIWKLGDAALGTFPIPGDPVGFRCGDAIGLSLNAGEIGAWYRPAGGLWQQLGSRTDTSYAGGVVGFGLMGSNTTSPVFTAFGGGETRVNNARGLTCTLTDLTGAPVESGSSRPLPNRTPSQVSVTIPLCDSRSGSVVLSAYDDAAGPLADGAATTAMKVFYTNPKGTRILLLNGIVLQPTTDFDAATVTASIIDPTLRLKKRFCHWNHVAMALSDGVSVAAQSYDAGVDAFAGVTYYLLGTKTDYGIPMDGRGLRILLWDCQFGTWDRSGSNATASATPGTGITPGIDNSTQQPDMVSGVPPNGVPSFTATATAGSRTLTGVSFSGGYTIADILEFARINGPGIPAYCSVASASGTTITMTAKATATSIAGTFATEDAIYCQLTRGDCMYDDIQDIVLAGGSFQFRLVPIDSDNFGPSGLPWQPTQMAELYTADQLATDRSQTQALAGGGVTPVVFVHGEGGFHLVYAPDADQLRTYVTEVGPGGPADPLDQRNKALVYGDTTETYGLYEDWEMASSAGNGDEPISNALLENRAAAVLAAYQRVPEFITATIDSDQVGQYCYGTDFLEGDVVTVYGKKGNVTVGPLDVRITSVQISQVDNDGNCKIDLTMAPYLTVVSGIGTTE